MWLPWKKPSQPGNHAHPSDLFPPMKEGCEAWEEKPGALGLRPIRSDSKLLKY